MSSTSLAVAAPRKKEMEYSYLFRGMEPREIQAQADYAAGRARQWTAGTAVAAAVAGAGFVEGLASSCPDAPALIAHRPAAGLLMLVAGAFGYLGTNAMRAHWRTNQANAEGGLQAILPEGRPQGANIQSFNPA
jgi:hypothetical protein